MQLQDVLDIHKDIVSLLANCPKVEVFNKVLTPALTYSAVARIFLMKEHYFLYIYSNLYRLGESWFVAIGAENILSLMACVPRPF